MLLPSSPLLHAGQHDVSCVPRMMVEERLAHGGKYTMRYDKGRRVETAARILDHASVRIRERGLDSITVAAVMKMAGLTPGGFYFHFEPGDQEKSIEGKCGRSKDPSNPLAAYGITPRHDFLRRSYDVVLLVVAVGRWTRSEARRPFENLISAGKENRPDKVHGQLEKRRSLERKLADFRFFENLVQQLGLTVAGSLK